MHRNGGRLCTGAEYRVRMKLLGIIANQAFSDD